MKILTFGEVIWDKFGDRACIGGAPLNFSAHCSRCSAESDIITAVGNDELAGLTLYEICRLGVGTQFVQKNDRPTGSCIVTLSEAGIPSYNIVKGTAYDSIKITPEIISAISKREYDAFCFGTLAQRSEPSRRSLVKLLEGCRFKTVLCDINLRPDCYDVGSVANCLKYATALKLSREEEPLLQKFDIWKYQTGTEGLVKLFSDYPQLTHILYTAGGDGSTVICRGGESFYIPAYGDTVVSTVGAGDCFGAVWLCRYLATGDPKCAAETASRVSGYVVSVTEAVPDYSIDAFN